jgi:hypothetical protein
MGIYYVGALLGMGGAYTKVLLDMVVCRACHCHYIHAMVEPIVANVVGKLSFIFIFIYLFCFCSGLLCPIVLGVALFCMAPFLRPLSV